MWALVKDSADRLAVPAVTVQTVEGEELAAGNAHSLALRSDGSVWALGRNEFGPLGGGRSANRTTPVPVRKF